MGIPKLRDLGLLNRFCLTAPARWIGDVHRSSPVPSETRASYNEFVYDLALASICNGPRTVTLDSQARARNLDW